MRNLKLVESVQVDGVTALVGAQCICVDYDTKAVYCATAKGMSMLDPITRQASVIGPVQAKQDPTTHTNTDKYPPLTTIINTVFPPEQ